MIVVVLICAVLLAAAATLAVVRAEKGPSMLDRTIALDVFTTTLVGTIALEAAWSRRTETIPILVVLSLVGFVGSVTIARFASVEPEGEGRIKTREEIAAEEAERLAAEEGEHDKAADPEHGAEHEPDALHEVEEAAAPEVDGSTGPEEARS
ncbi:pH regulation protein F [Oerskovia turbata]|uniref:PH regulation protein F n=1 Tax=Oerskovia turbata TaxID=1713 RepID=A0A4Q1KT55_9CELL|nr:MrpF/PhaF family protein [Oerskovia turbata]RXR25730.1 pH regulation protein F [Oerskovia turbata]RXR33182.1 pH regulation protein F [Oerskovia turbata]TGJ96253.1 pH regulation protein F [Actinotalea fermentans ATCC 43279 = JCM 9966 = DSM 3133]